MMLFKGYYGDIFVVMSVCDFVNLMYSMYFGFLFEYVFVFVLSVKFNGEFSFIEVENLENYFVVYY